MAEFKLGILASEYTLPTTVTDELPCDRDDLVDTAEMADGSLVYNFKGDTPRSWTIEWDDLTSAECDTLDTIAALKAVLNYINGYQGLAAGVSVVVSHASGRILKVSSSGQTTIRYRYSMTLREA